MGQEEHKPGHQYRPGMTPEERAAVREADIREHVAPASEYGSEFDKFTCDMRLKVNGWLESKHPVKMQREEIAKLVVAALAKIGHFYFDADLRDFDSAMFFNSFSKRLERIRSDAFSAWLSAWATINRADTQFHFITKAVETAALHGKHTTGITPEAFWASRDDAIYLSNGYGQLVRITAKQIELLDNGTDGILFPVGRTLKPWKLTKPRDPFKTCKLFADAHCDAEHGKELLRLWMYSLPTNPPCKPPLCLTGPVGSGKTREVKGMAELYGIPFIAQKVEEEAEKDFWPCVNAGGLHCLDNADTRCRWLPDAVANAATDGCAAQRKLYTNSETVTLRARAWLVITSANPSFASDAGLADRLIVVRMMRREGDTSDAALSEEIAANRDAGLSHIAKTLHLALADTAPTPGGLNARHPDFAALAVKIGRALGRGQEAVAALKAAEADKAQFLTENDAVASALMVYLREHGKFSGPAKELLTGLRQADPDFPDRISAKGLGKRLAQIWPQLQQQIATCQKNQDRKGITNYEFTSATKPATQDEPQSF
jgi:hypothetical protein